MAMESRTGAGTETATVKTHQISVVDPVLSGTQSEHDADEQHHTDVKGAHDNGSIAVDQAVTDVDGTGKTFAKRRSDLESHHETDTGNTEIRQITSTSSRERRRQRRTAVFQKAATADHENDHVTVNIVNEVQVQGADTNASAQGGHNEAAVEVSAIAQGGSITAGNTDIRAQAVPFVTGKCVRGDAYRLEDHFKACLSMFNDTERQNMDDVVLGCRERRKRKRAALRQSAIPTDAEVLKSEGRLEKMKVSTGEKSAERADAESTRVMLKNECDGAQRLLETK
jgi:hypothetical protein